MKRADASQRGMTPLELLIAVTTVGVLLLMVVIFIERTLAIERSRDLVRLNDVQLIISSLLQYQIDHAGLIPAGIDTRSSKPQMIGIDGQVCTDYCPNQPLAATCAFLPELVPIYLARIPQDPAFTVLGPSGYYIHKIKGRSGWVVGSCIAEAAASIESSQ